MIFKNSKRKKYFSDEPNISSSEVMKVNYPPYAVMNLMKELEEKVAFAREFGVVAEIKTELFKLYDKVDERILNLRNTIESNNYTPEYADFLCIAIEKLLSGFPNSYAPGPRVPLTLQEAEKPTFKRQQEANEPKIQDGLSLFDLIFDYFKKLNFLNTDLVIIGANGSGKTFLANDIRKHIRENGIIVSAQRFLLLPAFKSIKSLTVTKEKLKKSQIQDKTSKNLNVALVQGEFETLIQHLLADDIEAHRKYKRKAHESSNLGKVIDKPTLTNLEKTFDIWNSLFNHLRISLEDEINIKAFVNTTSYPVTEMSEGEKVVLYLIAQVIQAPLNGFIIVDEPEMHLHPTIHKKLWDRLENERLDSKFIYLTHDLDFATSRRDTKKLWLRSFEYPHLFNIEEIPTNDIPQLLLLELLGCRQNIIFCEGEIGSLDDKVYNILFPNYIVKPVGGCLSVISYTKAFNKIPNIITKAVGIIDADYHSQERLSALESEKIYGLKLAEVENLLLDEEVLKTVCLELNQPEETVTNIKEAVIKRLLMDKELQVSNYVSNKVDHYFKDTNVSRGPDLPSLKSNLQIFIDKVHLESWTSERREYVESVIAQNDYTKAVQIFNNKGLEAIANTKFRIKDFYQRAVKTLQKDKSLQTRLLGYFPEF